jgi:hypothetical protein
VSQNLFFFRPRSENSGLDHSPPFRASNFVPLRC